MKKKYLILFVVSFIGACNNSENHAGVENKDSSLITSEIQNKKQTNETLEPTNSFPTIKIGNQEWMINDIKKTIYNNGDPILEAKKKEMWKDYGDKKIGCYRKLTNGTFLYNGFAINDPSGLIPTGFVLPKYEHFYQLMKFLGSVDSQSGKATKSIATYSIFIEEWVGDQENGGLEDIEIKTNGKSGFNAKKGGFVYDHGSLGNEGNCSYWWTSTIERGNTIVFDIGYCSQDLGGGKGSYPLTFGFALRAFKK